MNKGLLIWTNLAEVFPKVYKEKAVVEKANNENKNLTLRTLLAVFLILSGG